AATTTTSSQQQTPAAQTASSSSTSATQTSAVSWGTSTSATSSATSAQPISTLVVATTAAASQYTTTTSGGVVVTVYTTPSVAYVATSTQSSSGSTSFWSNIGAVAGVFSAIGLIGLALFILLETTAIRRRRAIKFDKDIAAAAGEAAKPTRSPFDDFSESGGGGFGYSDNGHGAYGKSLFLTESYGMSEVAQYDPYFASAAAAIERARSRKESEVGAPGIAGVGAGNPAREPSRRAPYHAFTGPNSQDPQVPAADLRYPRSTATQDILEAAGLARTGAAAMANNRARAFINRRPSEYTQNTRPSVAIRVELLE
ncbi:hypothetical protein ID866_11043, partial [Astraeus odoratus]